MIQTRDCPECNAEHRLHIKKCGCGYVFASQGSSSEASYPVAETRAAYDERIKREMAERKGARAKEYMAPNPSRAWAYRLMEREANKESLPHVSKIGWREALGYPMDTEAKTALEAAA